MSSWKLFLPVEGVGNFQEAIERCLMIRRKGKTREGRVIEINGEKWGENAVVVYPELNTCADGESKRGTYCNISKFDSYEIEPTQVLWKFLWQLSTGIENPFVLGSDPIPLVDQDRPDVDILGLFLENNALIVYKQSYEGINDTNVDFNKTNRDNLIESVRELIKNFGGKVDPWKRGEGNSEIIISIREARERLTYFLEAALRIAFWCIYNNEKEGFQNREVIEKIADIMNTESIPLRLRFRAARIMHLLEKREVHEAILSCFICIKPRCFLSGLADQAKERGYTYKLSAKEIEISRLAQYDLSNKTGKLSGYFY